jgi:predicted metal-dependent hydrolase
VSGALDLVLRGRPLTVPLRRDRRARRITIHIDVAIGGARVTMPIGASTAEAENALREHGDWLLQRLDALPARVPFAEGATIPYSGEPHRIIHGGARRGMVERCDGEIRVFGSPEHLARRLRDWLKMEARTAISSRAHEKAARIDRQVRHISIRDQRSRWGSCSAQRRLSFNWRLILAPDPVLDYVVGHEVAHMVEMNHSKKFWRAVDQVTPHARFGRRWLGSEGNGLYRYG